MKPISVQYEVNVKPRKFRALTDGPGWKRGEFFTENFLLTQGVVGRLVSFAELIVATRRVATLNIDFMGLPFFEEIKHRKIAIYEVDITEAEYKVVVQFPSFTAALTPERIEDRD